MWCSLLIKGKIKFVAICAMLRVGGEFVENMYFINLYSLIDLLVVFNNV
jgi:hypothetical protein